MTVDKTATVRCDTCQRVLHVDTKSVRVARSYARVRGWVCRVVEGQKVDVCGRCDVKEQQMTVPEHLSVQEELRPLVEAVLRVGDNDPERSHGMTDDLYVLVLKAVACGHPEPEELAREVLRIHEANLTRWYA